MADDLGSMLGAAALTSGSGIGGNALLWGIIGLGAGLLFSGGFSGLGNNNTNALQNDMQRGFDNQNNMANQREILGAITNGTAQSVATTNQVFHDTLNVLQDKYNETTRDIYGVSGQIAQVLANQNECCCSTKMLINEGINSIKEQMAQNKIETLQGQISNLQLQLATGNVVRYPNATTYNAGMPPFPPYLAPFTPFA